MRIEDWFLTAAERGNPAYTLPDWSTGNLVVRARARRRRTSPDWSTWCPRSSRTTTSSSPTGAATPTSGSAPRARRSGRCSATRPSAAWSSRGWSGAATTTSCPTARSRTATSATTSARRAARCCSTSGCAAPGRTTRRLVSSGRPASGGPDVAFAGRHRPVPHPPRRRRPPRRPADRADGEGVRRAPALARRPAGAAAARSSGCSTACSASAGRTRARSTPTTRSPTSRTGSATSTSPRTRCRSSRRTRRTAGPCAVQVLRTYPAIRPKTPYAPHGERSVARGYGKAFRRARRLMYLEDQYMWSPHIARLLADALRAIPSCTSSSSCRGTPTSTAASRCRPNEVGRMEAIEVVQKVAHRTGCTCSTSRTHAGTPVYVHAKVCVVDDVWACAGSANLNRRSWSHDGELSCAVLDDDARRARAARPRRARRRRPPLRPRPAADADARAPRPRAEATTPICSTRDDAVRPWTPPRTPSTLARRRPGRPAAAGAAAPAPTRRSCRCGRGCGPCRRTGSSTTRTAVRSRDRLRRAGERRGEQAPWGELSAATCAARAPPAAHPPSCRPR